MQNERVINPRPLYTADQALERALRLEHHGTYHYGANDRDAESNLFDCWSFIRYCYGIPVHRPGYNRGAWESSVVDDVNANSAIEDALHGRTLFELVDAQPAVGDVLTYPTIYRPGAQPWIGHGALVLEVDRAGPWNTRKFGLLTILECIGPDGRYPAIRRSTGIGFDAHSITFPDYPARLLRVVP